MIKGLLSIFHEFNCICLPNFLTTNLLSLRGKMNSPPGGLEPPTFRLTAERASRLRHGGLVVLWGRILGKLVFKHFSCENFSCMGPI